MKLAMNKTRIRRRIPEATADSWCVTLKQPLFAVISEASLTDEVQPVNINAVIRSRYVKPSADEWCAAGENNLVVRTILMWASRNSWSPIDDFNSFIKSAIWILNYSRYVQIKPSAVFRSRLS